MTARVLIVEDEESILLSLEFLLNKEGYAVTTARDGAAALQLLEAQAPDLVLLDVMLPLIDGFELCRLIRKNPALRGTKIMLLTARGRETEIARGLALGADSYMTKPFSTRDLMDKVRGLLPVNDAAQSSD
jgi:two-component system alkaline phosphatase synthesis response regulator PhoP